MKKAGLVLIGTLLAVMPGLGQAGGYGHGYYGFHGGPIGYRGNYYRGGFYRGHRFRHRHRRGGDRFGYLVGGLALGALATSVLSRPRHTHSSRQVVYVERPVNRAPRSTVRQVSPAQLDSWYYRDRDGNCSFIERDANGDEIVTPVAPQECDI